MKLKKRKLRPNPPDWFWWETDNCWRCKHRGGCNGCKILKLAGKKQKTNVRKKDFRGELAELADASDLESGINL